MESTPTASNDTKPGILESYFRVSERGSSLAQEIRGGAVTFFAMAYILVLNPIILSGPDSTGAFLGGGTEANMPAIAAGTALIAGVMTIFMGAFANFPIALAAARPELDGRSHNRPASGHDVGRRYGHHRA